MHFCRKGNLRKIVMSLCWKWACACIYAEAPYFISHVRRMSGDRALGSDRAMGSRAMGSISGQKTRSYQPLLYHETHMQSSVFVFVCVLFLCLLLGRKDRLSKIIFVFLKRQFEKKHFCFFREGNLIKIIFAFLLNSQLD